MNQHGYRVFGSGDGRASVQSGVAATDSACGAPGAPEHRTAPD